MDWRKGSKKEVHQEFPVSLDEAVRYKSEGSEDHEDIHGNHTDKHRHAARVVLRSTWFPAAIGVIIVFNAITIGIEQSLEIQGHDTTWVRVLEGIWLFIYIVELALRIYVDGLACFQSAWVRFDAVLVFLGVLTSWIIEPAMQDTHSVLGLLMVLRTARLMRLVKTARVLTKVREFWMLIRGFLHSASLVLYTFILLLSLVYIFSSLGIEVITKHTLNVGPDPDPDFQALVRLYFSSLPQTMMTLLRFVCMDEMSEVYNPLITKDPWLSIYFVAVIIVVGIVVMNLVASVIFSTALEQNAEERDAEKVAQEEESRKLITSLKRRLSEADLDGTGDISRSEIAGLDKEIQWKLCQALGVSTPMQVFNALDVHSQGKVPITEFFDGLWDIALAKAPVDMKRMEKQVNLLNWRFQDTLASQEQMLGFVKQTLAKLSSCQVAVERVRKVVDPTSPRSSAKLTEPVAWQRSVSEPTECLSPKGDVPDESIHSVPIDSFPPWAADLLAQLRHISDTTLQQMQPFRVKARVVKAATKPSSLTSGSPRMAPSSNNGSPRVLQTNARARQQTPGESRPRPAPIGTGKLDRSLSPPPSSAGSAKSSASAGGKSATSKAKSKPLQAAANPGAGEIGAVSIPEHSPINMDCEIPVSAQCQNGDGAAGVYAAPDAPMPNGHAGGNCDSCAEKGVIPPTGHTTNWQLCSMIATSKPAPNFESHETSPGDASVQQ